MLKIFLSILLFNILTSCSNNSLQELPEWYLNSSQNDLSRLYGTGYGTDLNSAEKDALNNLAQKIIVNISSSMEILKQERTFNQTSNFSESSKQAISSEVEKISFNNYKNEQSSSSGKYIYSLVSIDRDELSQTYIDKINNANSKIDALYTELQKKSLIEQKADFLQIDKIIALTQKDLIILRAISQEQALIAPHLKKYNNLNSNHQIVNNKLSIYFETDDLSQQITTVLSSKVTRNNIKVNKTRSFAKDEAVFKITSQQNTQYLYGSYWIKNESTLSVISSNNKVIKLFNFTTKGSSVISYAEAENAMSQNFAKQIKEKDFFNLIGFY
ncbi:MAG: LPP20 family lipoprotein [Rickettsiales bacterium]|nr:LPP20 family lipoprotein [Rickettsiales bacterium]